MNDEEQDDLIAEIRDNRDKAEDADRDNREEMEDDLKFSVGDQWPESDRTQREEDNRPCLQMNMLTQFIRQVTGDIRLNRPAIRVRPVDSGADTELAKVYTGIVRHIEASSDATGAYIAAAESAARCGLGNFRIVTEYMDDGFEQDIRIKRIDNPFAVLWDPMAQEPSKSDANWCFVDSEMDMDAFREMYPDASTQEFETQEVDSWLTNWYTNETVTVSEYWRKERMTRTIGLTVDNRVLDLTDNDESEYEGLGIIRTRRVESHKVVQYITNGAEILDGPFEWPGKHIPIIPVVGEEVHLGERVVRHGLIRFAKDPQRLYNYWHTMAAETIALAPKAPYLLTKDEIAGYESEWEDANKRPRPYLIYNPDPSTNGRPIRPEPPELPVAALQGMNAALEGLNRTTGIYPPSLGQQSNETSGRAIIARQREGDVGTYVFIDNLSRSIAYAGEQLVDLIPKIYDTQRIIRIIGEDDSEEMMEINVQTGVDEEGNPTLENDITVGKYDVVVDTGPSFSTKRQEAATSMIEFMRTMPDAGALIADLLVKNLDWPLADKIAERLKGLLPPGIDEDAPPAPQGPSPEQQIDMMKAQADMMKAQADLEKTRAEIAKTGAEAEGQQIDNLDQTLELAMKTGRFQEMVAAEIGRQLGQFANRG